MILDENSQSSKAAVEAVKSAIDLGLLNYYENQRCLVINKNFTQIE